MSPLAGEQALSTACKTDTLLVHKRNKILSHVIIMKTLWYVKEARYKIPQRQKVNYCQGVGEGRIGFLLGL
jgi:hypothetical protein